MPQALGALYRNVQQQSSLLACADNFRLMAALSFLCIPWPSSSRKPKRTANSLW